MAEHPPRDIPEHLVAREVRAALHEDIGPGDLTSSALVPVESRARATITAAEPLVVAGLDLARQSFIQLDPDSSIIMPIRDGEQLEPGATLLEIEASAQAILSAERTALNFLGRLSGIATLTRRCVDTVKGTPAEVLDTRKTTPGWRLFERQAVRLGGGVNHRFGLFDAVLIKDNHLALTGSPTEAVRKARKLYGSSFVIEVELETLSALEGVLEAGCDIVLIDNMPPATLVDAVRRRDTWVSAHKGRHVLLEASGGITLENIRAFAESGVDRISLGALTHSALSADLRLELET